MVSLLKGTIMPSVMSEAYAPIKSKLQNPLPPLPRQASGICLFHVPGEWGISVVRPSRGWGIWPLPLWHEKNWTVRFQTIFFFSGVELVNYGSPQGTCRFVICFPASILRTRNSKFSVYRLEILSLETRNFAFRKISKLKITSLQTRNFDFVNLKEKVTPESVFFCHRQ